MQAFLAFLTMFSGPIGQLITNGITIGAGAATTWMISKGMPADSASVIVGAVVTTAGALINSATGTQLVQIQSVRAAQNGVTVVPVDQARKAGIPSVDGPLK